jgi:hypothetical protein
VADPYRAIPVTQRDGSALANSNCRMASIATGIDFQTGGALTSTGSEMRARQSDQSGGTDSGDAAEAWDSYDEELRIRDGASFGDALADLNAGRLVHLDVWQAACAGPCMSGTGQFGHTIAVAPEQSGSRWLVADPWCSPPKWVWWEEALLREGAQTWGDMCYSGATSGRGELSETVLVALMRLVARRLMTEYRPDAPALVPPSRATGGSSRIMFTTTAAHAEPPPAGTTGDDVMYNVAPLTTHRSAIVRNCADLFADSSLTSPVDIGSEGQPLGFAGSTADAHVVVKGDIVLYVRRDDVLEIITLDTEYT